VTTYYAYQSVRGGLEIHSGSIYEIKIQKHMYPQIQSTHTHTHVHKSYRGVHVFAEFARAKVLEQRRLPHARRSHNEQLDFASLLAICS
jgi:hypothetical protein